MMIFSFRKFDTNGDLKWAASMGNTWRPRLVFQLMHPTMSTFQAGFKVLLISILGACAFNQSSAGGDDMFITKLNQVTTSPLSITSLSPGFRPHRVTSSNYWTGFSTTASDNAVEFNGTAAIVSGANNQPPLITVAQATTTGSIKVTVSWFRGTRSTNFTVTAAPSSPLRSHQIILPVLVKQPPSPQRATGTNNITFQWQFSPDGIVPYVDITNGNGLQQCKQQPHFP